MKLTLNGKLVILTSMVLGLGIPSACIHANNNDNGCYYEYEEENNHPSVVHVTDYEYISLCNLVANEYGSDWVSVYDKGAVVATVIHRVWNGGWVASGCENNIINVISAPYQYDGAYCSWYYSDKVTDSVKEAVDYALNNMDVYEYYTDPQGEVHYNIQSFYGDGYYNYFY